jgi:phosphate-selective porin
VPISEPVGGGSVSQTTSSSLGWLAMLAVFAAVAVVVTADAGVAGAALVVVAWANAPPAQITQATVAAKAKLNLRISFTPFDFDGRILHIDYVELKVVRHRF